MHTLAAGDALSVRCCYIILLLLLCFSMAADLRTSRSISLPSLSAACDVMEDVAIAYGYNNLVKRVPKTATVGRELPLNQVGGRAHYECTINTWVLLLLQQPDGPVKPAAACPPDTPLACCIYQTNSLLAACWARPFADVRAAAW